MALFPVYLELQGQYCLIFGGGRIAQRKLCQLVEAQADVHVMAKQVSPQIHTLAQEGRVILEDAAGDPQVLLAQACLVICATDDDAFNQRIAAACRQMHILVSCATDAGMEDGADVSSFFFPSVIRRGPVCIGIATYPAVPSANRCLRQRLETQTPPWADDWVMRLAQLRRQLRTVEADRQIRSRVMYRLTDYGMEHNGCIPDEVFRRFYSEEKKNRQRQEMKDDGC